MYELPVKNLEEPPLCRLLRKVDPVFVASLKARIASDPHATGVPPAAVICHDVSHKDDFEKRLMNVYMYEVQGGLHGVTARQQLAEEFPESQEYKSVLAFVYVGLTDEEALRLATKHNINGHFNHQMTHRDYVSLANLL